MSLINRDKSDARKDNLLEVTPVNRITENADAFTLTLELPGVLEKEVEVSLEDRTLTVNAVNGFEEHKGYTLALNEIPAVRYRAAFELPERIDTAMLKATCKGGLLVMTLPKREEVKPRRIAISAG